MEEPSRTSQEACGITSRRFCVRWHHLQLFTSECMLGPFARRCTTCRHQIVEHRLSAFHDRAVDRVHCHAPNSYRISGSAPLASLQLSWSIEILHHNIAWQALFIEAHSPYSMCGGGLRATHARSMNGLTTTNLLSGRKQTTPPSTIDASRLSDHFGGVVSDPSRPRHLVSPAGPSTRDSLEEFPVCEIHEIHKLLRGLNSKKATGSDQLPAAILKSCALVLAPSLTIIVNASLTSGIVPSALKQADIRPLFKAGDREAPKNYRPVSLLPVVSKVLERVVHSRLF